MERVKEIWNEFYNGNYNNIYSFIDTHENLIKQAAVKDKERWGKYHGSQTISTYIDRTTEVLRKNAAWLNEQWKTSSNPGGNDNPGGNEGGGDNEGSLSEVTSMYVWVNGQSVEYPIAQVDSITFAKKEGIVVKAKVPESWSDVYVYIWDTEGVETGDYKASKQGDWYVYTYFGKELNIIFKEGKDWRGHPYQTEDLKTNRSGCYVITQVGENKGVFNEVDCE